MTNKEYIELKKNEYCNIVNVESIEACEDDDIKQEWFARLNQIRSGQLLGLTSSEIDKYITLEGYARREFVKSCLQEGISEDVIAKMVECVHISEMLKLKKEYYKSDYIINNIDNKMNTIRGAVDDCEQKFVVFEKYLDSFSNQVEAKDKEIEELKSEIKSLREKLNKAMVDMANVQVKAIENAVTQPTQRNIVITRVFENPEAGEEADKKNKKGILNVLSRSTATKDAPQYIKKSVEKKITDIESYIIGAKLSSEQLLEISKAISMDVSDEQIVMMIENEMSPMQIRNCVNIIIAKKNAEKRKMAASVVNDVPDVANNENEQNQGSISDMISDMEEIDEDYIEEMEDIYE